MQTLGNLNLQQMLDGVRAPGIPTLRVLDRWTNLGQRHKPPLQSPPVGVNNCAVRECLLGFVARIKGVFGNAHGVKRPNDPSSATAS